MAQTSPIIDHDIPDSFFNGTEDVMPRPPGRPAGTFDTRALPAALVSSQGWEPQKAMFWYDSIIDDMLSNPGTTYKDTAKRLGKSPTTIGMIVRSDMFKARYAQRREAYNKELHDRLTGKLAKVAETALDLTQEKMNSQRTGVPLPLLHEIATTSLEKLGYGAGPRNPTVAVQVNNNNNGTAPVVAVPVTAEALAESRAVLRSIEQSRLLESRGQGPTGLVVEVKSDDGPVVAAVQNGEAS